MVYLLLTIFLLSVLGIAACGLMRGPMIRALEERHGLSGVSNAVREARAARAAERDRSQELSARGRKLRAKLAEAEKDLKRLEADLVKLPAQVFELTFEIGAQEGNASLFEFLVTKPKRPQNPVALQGREWEIWSRPRLLRVWSRNQATALAAAQQRFPSADGFVLRGAERIAVSGRSGGS